MAPLLRALGLALLALRACPSAALLLKADVGEPYWPVKNGNLNHTGLSRYRAPFNLEKPAWIFEPAQLPFPVYKNGQTVGSMKVFHSTPILDSEKNSYIVSTTGWLYSVDSEGRLRWKFELSGLNPGNPALLDGVLYTESSDGIAFAIDAATGHEIWRARIGDSVSGDSYSVVALGDTVIMQANFKGEKAYAAPGLPSCGTSQVVAVSTADGSVKWRYEAMKRSGAVMLNADPAIVDGSVVFADTTGGIYRVRLADGEEQWFTPGVAGTSSTGGMAVGPNDMVYVTGQYKAEAEFNGLGLVRAADLASGEVRWTRKFPRSANVAPAVGPVGPHGELSVVLPIGYNMAPAPFASNFVTKALLLAGKTEDGEDYAATMVYALDAETGEPHWVLKIPAANYVASTKGSSRYNCAPDVMGTPAIGADGVVYINWSGGRAFAMRDADRNGVIDASDPLELSSYEHGYGTNGESAIAPGLLVAPSCNLLIGFKQ